MIVHITLNFSMINITNKIVTSEYLKKNITHFSFKLLLLEIAWNNVLFFNTFI